VPTAAVQPAVQAANQAVQAATPAVNAVGQAVTAVATAAIAPQVQLVNVISGQTSLSTAAQNLVKSQGQQISSVAQAVSATDAAANNVSVVAATAIAGNVGQTIMQIGTGASRLQVEFATTTAIEAGQIAQGDLNANRLVAVPLAAAIRAAENQFAPSAKSVPDNVKAALSPFYPKAILDNARYAISSISLAIPDLVNQAQKTFEGADNAVTVGNIMVFRRDPGTSFHWWAHELGHVEQYSSWGIDDFAFRYVTSCHSVEAAAEARAQTAVPFGGPVNLVC
jgi:hypothetical protein